MLPHREGRIRASPGTKKAAVDARDTRGGARNGGAVSKPHRDCASCGSPSLSYDDPILAKALRRNRRRESSWDARPFKFEHSQLEPDAAELARPRNTAMARRGLFAGEEWTVELSHASGATRRHLRWPKNGGTLRRRASHGPAMRPCATGAGRRAAAEAVLAGGLIGLSEGRSLRHGCHSLHAGHQRRRLAGLCRAARGDCERDR